MNNILLIIEREYMERVKKKSFLLATILTPLIFPAFIALAAFLAVNESTDVKSVFIIDESGYFGEGFDITDFDISVVDKTLDEGVEALNGGQAEGVLFIPKMDIDNPQGIAYYSKSNPGLGFLNRFRRPIKEKIEDLKLARLDIDKEVIDNLRASVSISNFNVSDTGEAKKSSSDIASLAGYVMAFLMYMFVFIYGSFIMQSVLSEKTSKIVEVIVSSVKPFHLMIGKVLANAAVALTQFAIWVVLIATFTFLLSAFFNYDPGAAQQQMVQEQLGAADVGAEDLPPELVANILDVFAALPVGQILTLFIFYFLGGFLLYGALFAAVGSAVDSLQEAQQFMLPVSLPIILSLLLMGVALQNPNGATAVSLSMIPFTSPIIMLARVPFEVPIWQIIVSLLCLVGGFLMTIWFAGRIYRVGILTSGSKVTYKVLAKWFMMKNY